MHNPLHIAIVGGGAAGFFAAIAAKQNNPHTDITIFEKEPEGACQGGNHWWRKM